MVRLNLDTEVALYALLIACANAFGDNSYILHNSNYHAVTQTTTKVYQTSNNNENAASSQFQSRRAFANSLLGITTAATLISPTRSFAAEAPSPLFPDNPDDQIDVYFGCGCFWHVQHEFIQAERRILGRSDDKLSARTGYAGGTKGMLDNKVCYHNGKRVSDYGSLGHAEVVRLRIPPQSYPEFAAEYARLFDKNGSRPDQDGDRGLEYRNLVGIPGGSKQTTFPQQLIDASKQNGDKLAFAEGSGDDFDRRALVFVMDTAKFPFYVSEQYHQFHDGFKRGENYPDSYNQLGSILAKANVLGVSGCPDGML
mmetsp:Transcript_6737/g.7739  ORF Transcript_6737/g.7739 Transcript_6737/m.7739 type:complete len:312 (+) Transcript_6737:223-1158(+)|eukprot:CAMPEP_0194363906 /NCGR_PEP_ID=MMETSP0174-20130528/11774_1 /TAXON_ID=216777 /ORGANISM="Proboscia alata, Strain PI-D3" /LENGTH=311 /DNA_ID=CAMNT_0039137629 /DNA_START=587 /DNA_END=1522 /DNA_ORIENTATION=-